MLNQITDRSELISIISDLHKDAYGYRDRNTDYSDATMDELVETINMFQEVINKEMEYEALQKEANIKAFNELLAKTINLGANDYNNALRWLFDGSGIGRDTFAPVESFLYHYGLDNTGYGVVIQNSLEEILY